jgi:hypothetical protein
MAKPELKQFGDLLPADFDRHAVWINCHFSDYEEPWYEETDEETFRPWNGLLPVSPADGMLLVRAVLVLADGTRFPGFVTPASREEDLGTQQPQIFIGQRQFGFWGGVLGGRKQNGRLSMLPWDEAATRFSHCASTLTQS